MLIKYNNHLLKIYHKDIMSYENTYVKCTDNKKIQCITEHYRTGVNAYRIIMVNYYKSNDIYYYYIFSEINSLGNPIKIIFHLLDSKVEYKVNLKKFSGFSKCFTKLAKYFDYISD